jgi:hypothetical protein
MTWKTSLNCLNPFTSTHKSALFLLTDKFRFNVLPSSNCSLHSATTEEMAPSHQNNRATPNRLTQQKNKQIKDIQHIIMIQHGRQFYFMLS